MHYTIYGASAARSSSIPNLDTLEIDAGLAALARADQKLAEVLGKQQMVVQTAL